MSRVPSFFIWPTLLLLMDLFFLAAIANDGSQSASNASLAHLNSSSISTSSSPLRLSVNSLIPAPSFLVQSQNKSSKDDFSNLTIGGGEMDLFENSSFLSQNLTLINAQINSNALIPCLVRNSGDGVMVSWIRRKDYHLLTIGLQTYSSDNRFQVIHAQSPEDWTLKIKYVQPRDGGIYECSISTHPPSSIFVTLNVVEAKAEIPGGPDKYIKSGSTLRLICEFKMSTEQPEYVFWFQGLRMINYEPSRSIEVTHERYSSTLVLNNVQKSDSGNYSCVPSNASPANIFVHIINGENPAAMQHGSHSTTCVPCPPFWFLSIILSITLQHFYFQYLNNFNHYSSNHKNNQITASYHHHLNTR